MKLQRFINVSATLAAVLFTAGCGSAPSVVVPLVPLAPDVNRLAPEIASAAADNAAARAAIHQLTPANVPVVKPAVAKTLAHQKQALVSAAARVALLQVEAKRADGAAISLAQRQQQLTGDLAVAEAAAKAARNEYENSWLGGKAHRLIEWILGVGIVLLIVDFLASSFLGVGLNPFEWLAGLGRAAQVKHA